MSQLINSIFYILHNNFCNKNVIYYRIYVHKFIYYLHTKYTLHISVVLIIHVHNRIPNRKKYNK